MSSYDKSILRLLDACSKSLSNESKTSIIIYSEAKCRLEEIREVLNSTIKQGFLVTRKELAEMLVEDFQDEQEQYTISKCKTESILFLTDFQVIAGKLLSQRIIYDILQHRFVEGKTTIIFSEWDVFAYNSFTEDIKNLLETYDKFEI